MQIFNNANYDFIRWRWHALILSSVVIIGGLVLICRAAACRSASTSRAARSSSCSSSSRSRGRGPQGARRAARRKVRPAVRRRRRAPDPDPPAAGHRRRSRVQPRAGLAAGASTALAEGGLPASSRSSAREVVGPVVGADLQQKGIYATLASIVGITVYIALPLPVHLRRRRDRRDVPRHLRRARDAALLRLRAVAEHRRRDPDDHRLLGERHHRHLRPRAREHAAAAPRAARQGRQR